MYKDKRIIALIPARGGSKGVPNKNIKELAGLPLIAHSILLAQKSSYIDDIVVSTDSLEIASIARGLGAKVPFIRPGFLAQDTSLGIDVVKHALTFFRENGLVCDVLLLLQPTSPFRSLKDIDGCICSLIDHPQKKCIISVCKSENHPLLANTLPEDQSLSSFLRDDVKNKNRQALPEYYRLNGALYCAYPDYVFLKNSFFGEATYAYQMPLERSLDIDSVLDFQFAEFLCSMRDSR